MTPEEEKALPDYARQELFDLREENGQLVAQVDALTIERDNAVATFSTYQKQHDVEVRRRVVYSAALDAVEAGTKDVAEAQKIATDAKAAVDAVIPAEVAVPVEADPVPVGG